MAYSATLIPGDGIGPEVVGATIDVLAATGVAFDWDEQQAGLGAFEAAGNPLPEATVASIERTRLGLKGPLTTPVGKGFSSINVALRREFNLYANVRPAVTLPNVKGPFTGIDLVLYRENTEGMYSGMGSFDEETQVAQSVSQVTREGAERIVRFAFEDTRRRGRSRLTLVHKANILKETSGLFLKVGREIAPEFTDVAFDDRIVDNMAMQLVIRPGEYESIVTTNLFGDILSDLISGLVGGLGMTGSGNIGDDCELYEAVHGSAPDIAGKGIANPTALVRSGEMMLRSLGETAAADAINAALIGLYTEKTNLTGDLGGTATTSEFAQDLCDRVRRHMDAA